MIRLLPALMFGLAIVGCSCSADPNEAARQKPPQNQTNPGNDKQAPDLDPAVAAAQEKAIAFITGKKGKFKRSDHTISEVDLSFKPITDAELKELTTLTNLTVLNLNYTQVTDSGLKELATFNNLSTLTLRGTKVTGVGFRALSPLKNLSSLDLRATPVNDSGLREIATLKNLTTLDLIAIMGTVEGVNDLQRALPRCKIEKIQ
ncbi:MAG: hypothetical protein C0467_04090 [Planctomycetaceae bacterium]|nr:hypothetical protein [Planctomycetaceae bacterium]